MSIKIYILLRDEMWRIRHLQMKARRSCNGLRGHKLYNTWMAMLNRCYNPNSPVFPNYGARGIYVCDRWMSLKNFITDMKDSDGLTLDRADNDKEYSPDNCRWATKKEQAGNKRECKKIENRQRHERLMTYPRSPRLLHGVSCLGGYR